FHVTGVQTCALPIWRIAVDDAPTRLIRLGFERNAYARHGVHRLGQPARKTVAQGHVIYAERVFIPVDAGPYDGEVGVEFFVQFRSEERRVGKEWRVG